MRRKHIYILLFIFLTLVIICVYFSHNKKVYYAKDFNIEVLKSDIDYNKNGIDDYTDILIGARKDAENMPKYVSKYYEGGYPPDDEGVCTDVIWRAFKNAGYLLKDLVDKDIKENISEYPRVNGKPDPNIDFRRVPNLNVFFSRNAINLTTDTSSISDWQPGDIVVFGSKHIAIISDKRNKEGIPYIIHNAGGNGREEDTLKLWQVRYGIAGHYRWNKM